MTKLNVLLHYKMWPLAMGSYFLRAFQRREDINLITCGQFSGSYIPWKGGMYVPYKYVAVPDIVLPLAMNEIVVDYGIVAKYLQSINFKPDLVLTISSTVRWREKPEGVFSAAVAADPHVLDYDEVRKTSDKFFNMQNIYSKKGDVYLPYAYDPTIHYEDESVEKIWDVVMVGLEYPHRLALAQKLREMGLKVYISNGEIFDDYRRIYSQSKVGVNWSTLDDLNARAFELPMMSVPVMNFVTDMEHPRHSHNFSDVPIFYSHNAVQYKPVEDVIKSAEKVIEVMNDYETFRSMNLKTRERMRGETYDARVQEILDVCGFGG